MLRILEGALTGVFRPGSLGRPGQGAMVPAVVRVLLAAMTLMALAMGTRTAAGLFVSPLNTATGVGLAGLGFAIALGQLAQGLAQPPLGALADRFGSRRLIVAGAWLLGASTVGLAAANSVATFAIAFIAIALAGSAVGSSSLLLAEVGRRVPPAHRALAFSLVSAGGSAGQLLLAPATQAIIDGFGWTLALGATALLSLAALPLARAFGGATEAHGHRSPVPSTAGVGDALRTVAFWGSAGSFGICGFHVGFLTTHMPGVIERCGLSPSLAGIWLAVLGAANLVGSLGAGMLLRYVPTRAFVTAIFAVRGATVLLLLALPPTPVVMLGFAILMGLSYMALLPAISKQVSDRFGVERLATLFGVVALVHQAGSFGGVWLGGIVADMTGRDTVTWLVDVGLAVVAILLQLMATSLAPWPRSAVRLRTVQGPSIQRVSTSGLTTLMGRPAA